MSSLNEMGLWQTMSKKPNFHSDYITCLVDRNDCINLVHLDFGKVFYLALNSC